MKISLKDIYYEFFVMGMLLLGGGYVIVPLIRERLIDNRGWIKEEELIDFYALSQSIPGVIAANISIFTGYKLRGKRGAFVSLLGIVTSPIVLILVIASIIDSLLQFSMIQILFRAVGISVIVMIYLTLKEMWSKSIVDIFSWFLFFISFFLSYFLKISPVYIIIFAIFYGIIVQGFRGKK